MDVSIYVEDFIYEIIGADSFFEESTIGSEVGLTSDTILSCTLLLTSKEQEKVYIDLKTQKFAFNSTNLQYGDSLYEFGELIISLLNRYKSYDLFLAELDTLIKLGHFDGCEFEKTGTDYEELSDVFGVILEDEAN